MGTGTRREKLGAKVKEGRTKAGIYWEGAEMFSFVLGSICRPRGVFQSGDPQIGKNRPRSIVACGFRRRQRANRQRVAKCVFFVGLAGWTPELPILMVSGRDHQKGPEPTQPMHAQNTPSSQGHAPQNEKCEKHAPVFWTGPPDRPEIGEQAEKGGSPAPFPKKECNLTVSQPACFVLGRILGLGYTLSWKGHPSRCLGWSGLSTLGETGRYLSHCFQGHRPGQTW